MGGDVVWLQGSTTRYGPLERSRRVAGAVVVPPSFRQVQVYIDDVEPGTAQPAVSKGAVRLGSVWSLSCPSQRRAGQIRDLDWHNVRAPST